MSAVKRYMQAWTPSPATWSRKWRPTTRLPMRRPCPSGKTVRTVSTSSFRISDSSVFRSSRPGTDLPDIDGDGRGEEHEQHEAGEPGDAPARPGGAAGAP